MHDHSTRPPTRRMFFGRAAGTLAAVGTLSAAGPATLPMPSREPIDWFTLTLPGQGRGGRDIRVEVRRYAAADARWAAETQPLTYRGVDGSVDSITVILAPRRPRAGKGGAR